MNFTLSEIEADKSKKANLLATKEGKGLYLFSKRASILSNQHTNLLEAEDLYCCLDIGSALLIHNLAKEIPEILANTNVVKPYLKDLLTQHTDCLANHYVEAIAGWIELESTKGKSNRQTYQQCLKRLTQQYSVFSQFEQEKLYNELDVVGLEEIAFYVAKYPDINAALHLAQRIANSVLRPELFRSVTQTEKVNVYAPAKFDCFAHTRRELDKACAATDTQLVCKNDFDPLGIWLVDDVNANKAINLVMNNSLQSVLIIALLAKNMPSYQDSLLISYLLIARC